MFSFSDVKSSRIIRKEAYSKKKLSAVTVEFSLRGKLSSVHKRWRNTHWNTIWWIQYQIFNQSHHVYDHQIMQPTNLDYEFSAMPVYVTTCLGCINLTYRTMLMGLNLNLATSEYSTETADLLKLWYSSEYCKTVKGFLLCWVQNLTK